MLGDDVVSAGNGPDDVSHARLHLRPPAVLRRGHLPPHEREEAQVGVSGVQPARLLRHLVPGRFLHSAPAESQVPRTVYQ